MCKPSHTIAAGNNQCKVLLLRCFAQVPCKAYCGSTSYLQALQDFTLVHHAAWQAALPLDSKLSAEAQHSLKHKRTLILLISLLVFCKEGQPAMATPWKPGGGERDASLPDLSLSPSPLGLGTVPLWLDPYRPSEVRVLVFSWPFLDTHSAKMLRGTAHSLDYVRWQALP